MTGRFPTPGLSVHELLTCNHCIMKQKKRDFDQNLYSVHTTSVSYLQHKESSISIELLPVL